MPAAIPIAAAVVGGAISSDASRSAANKQKDAANQATAAQQGMFDRTVELESPFRTAGVGAQAKLNNLLGIGAPQGGPGQLTGATLVDTSSGIPRPNADLYANNADYRRVWDAALADHQAHYGTGYGTGSDANEINQYLTGALAPQMAQEAQQPASSDYGSLLKPFGMDDFQLDPGIQFQTEQGNKALINSAASKNGVLSGAALKDFISYNQGMAGTGYQSAFDRYMAGKNFTLGSLMDVSKQGQAAAGNTTSAAPGFSSGISSTITGAGNAQAAGQVGSANAVSGGLSNAGNLYYLSSLLGKQGGDASSSSPGVVADNPLQNFG